MAVTPPIEDPETTSRRRPAAGWQRYIRLGVWAALAGGLVLFILFGSVAAISYRYYPFSGRVARLQPQRSLIEIWRDELSALPDFAVGWLPSAVLLVCIGIVVVGAMAGAWMLLVQTGDPRPRRSTRGG